MKKLLLSAVAVLGLLPSLTATASAELVAEDRSNWVIKGCSNETGEGDKLGTLNAMKDGNINTYWHTVWSSATHHAQNHYFVVDRGEDLAQTALSAVGYTPRQQTGGNGYVTECDIYILDSVEGLNLWADSANAGVCDGGHNIDTFISELTPTAHGSFSYTHDGSNRAESQVAFAPTAGRYILFVATKTNGDSNNYGYGNAFAHCAEFNAYTSTIAQYLVTLTVDCGNEKSLTLDLGIVDEGTTYTKPAIDPAVITVTGWEDGSTVSGDINLQGTLVDGVKAFKLNNLRFPTQWATTNGSGLLRAATSYDSGEFLFEVPVENSENFKIYSLNQLKWVGAAGSNVAQVTFSDTAGEFQLVKHSCGAEAIGNVGATTSAQVFFNSRDNGIGTWSAGNDAGSHWFMVYDNTNYQANLTAAAITVDYNSGTITGGAMMTALNEAETVYATASESDVKTALKAAIDAAKSARFGEKDVNVADLLQALTDATIAVGSLSTIAQTYSTDASFWAESPIYPAGLASGAASTGHGTAAEHVGAEGHTIYKAVTPVVANGVDMTITFTYTSATENVHGLVILGVDVVNASGEVVASDYHVGFTGGTPDNNVFTLSDVAAGNYMLRYYVCNKADDHELTRTGGTINATGVDLMTEVSDASAMWTTLAGVAENQYIAYEGTGIGYYESTDDIETAKSATATEETVAAYAAIFVSLDDAMDAVEMTMPKAGKFYRIQNDDQTGYLVAGTGTGNTKFEAVADNAANSIFYYTGEKLVSYTNGLYLALNNNRLSYTNTKGAAAGTTVDFKSVAPGKVNVTFNNGSRYLYSAGVGNTDAGDSPDHRTAYHFNVSEVEWLPIAINETFGWTTFFSPVELGFNGRVKAFVGTINNEDPSNVKLEVTEVTDAVPANTGVLLQLTEGAEVENGYVYLPVQETTITNVTSALTGAFEAVAVVSGGTEEVAVADAAAEVTTTSYFTFEEKTNDDNKNYGEFRLYSEDRSAFVAYVETTGDVTDETISISDSEGNDPTGIEEIVAESEKVQGIYDLQGRRLSAPVKGINIINGKKVLVK